MILTQLLSMIAVAYLYNKLYTKFPNGSAIVFPLIALLLPMQAFVFFASAASPLFGVFTGVIVLLSQGLTLETGIITAIAVLAGALYKHYKWAGIALITAGYAAFLQVSVEPIITLLSIVVYFVVLADIQSSGRTLEHITDLAVTDPLTGAYNRNCYESTIHGLLEQARKNEKPLSLLMIDIDHFKAYNDTHGHDAGDEALKTYVKIFTEQTRGHDLVVRWGGEEFAIMLPDTSMHWADVVATRLKKKAIELNLSSVKNGEPVKNTLSIGISTFPSPSDAKKTLEKHADLALYKAKEKRNHIELYIG